LEITHKITFLPMNAVCEADDGETVYQAAVRSGVAVAGDCGGAGTCGKCAVDIAGAGERLACQTRVERDMTVRVAIPSGAGGNGYNMKTAVALPPGFVPDRGAGFGAALDIGTTTVAGILWNLETGESMGALAASNPQAAYGADVISRLGFALDSPRNLKILQTSVVTCINGIIARLCASAGISPEDINKIAAAGNTAMSHILLGADPSGLARAPFAPSYTGAARVEAAALGIRANQETEITVLPNIAGHVGGDITAVLLYTGLWRLPGANLAVDIGTNGEILLCAGGRALACSAAAGPAFEGAAIQMGMRAETGAISGVRITGCEVELDIIGAGVPAGICGSGLIDAVAQLLACGIIDKTGKMAAAGAFLASGGDPRLARRIRRGEKSAEFALFAGNGPGQSDVVITQKDIREVQLAKAAVAAGINILLRELSLTARDLRSIQLAGAFGNFIDKSSAVAIGLLPDIPPERVVSIGNAAGSGASMALLSAAAMREAQEQAARVEHIELSAHPGFQEEFIGRMGF